MLGTTVRQELKMLLVLALPLILAQVAQASMSFVDTLMVGRLGSEQLAGIALGVTLFFLVYSLLSGVMFAVNPSVAQAVGAGKPEQASLAVRQGLWLGTLLFIPALLVYWNAGSIFTLMGQNPETVELASAYLRAISWGLLPALWFNALRGLLEGVADPRPIMVISLLGVGFNVLANFALMYGKWGFPELGLVGTGYASTLSYLFIFMLLAGYVSRYFGQYRVFADLRRPNFQAMAELAKIGVPIGLQLGFEGSMFYTMVFLMGLLGKAELAAHQIATQAAAVTFMVPLGLSLATSVRVGQAAGRGNREGAKLAGYVGIGSSALFMVFTALSFWLAPQFIIGLYLDVNDLANAEVVRLATVFLGIAAMFQLFDGFQVSASGALRGLKDTRLPMLITLVSYWFIGIGGGVWFCFALGLGGRGLWLGLVVGLAAAAIALTIRFRHLTRSGLEPNSYPVRPERK